MEFFEFATVFSLFVILPSIVLNAVVRMKKAKGAAKGSGDALHLSELQLLIEAAVDEATEPLRAQLARLEAERLIEAPRPPLTLEAPEAPRGPMAHRPEAA